MPSVYLSRLGFVGLGKETTMGTPVAASVFVPAKTMKPEEVIEYVDDDSIVANISKVRGVYQGVKDGAFEIGGMLFPDSVGSLLVGLGMFDSTTGTAGTKSGTTAALSVGATTATYTLGAGTAPVIGDVFQFDTSANGIAECRTLSNVSGAGPYTLTWVAPLQYAHAGGAAAVNVTGGTYTHSFKFSNNGGITQPPTWTITWYGAGVQGASSMRQYPGAILNDLTITVPVKGALTYSAKFLTWPSSTGSKPVPAFPTTAAFLGWEQALSINASSDVKYLGGSVNIKRNAEIIHTGQNSQNPYDSFAGEAEALLKWKFVPSDETEWNYIVTNTQPSSALTVTTPSSGPLLTITNTTGGWKKAPFDTGQKYIQVGDIEITGIQNSTDGGPIQATLANSTPVGY